MSAIYHNMLQGSEEWYEVRSGLVTASQLNLLLTPTLKIAKNDKVRAHAFEMAAQRENDFLEDTFQTWQMERGHIEEVIARDIYSEKVLPVEEVGFVTNDSFGFTLGYSPDGLVGTDGLIEIKSRIQKHQMKTIVSDQVPSEYMLQCQVGLLITGRKWLDFISYSNGMEMFIKRVLPDEGLQELIVQAVAGFEESVTEIREKYKANSKGLIKTERVDHLSDEGIISSSNGEE